MNFANMNFANMKSVLIPLALAAALGAGAFTPALAVGKAGGGAAGGGAVGGAGGVKDVGGTLVPLSSYGLVYNGKTPLGSATLGYAADGVTPQSFSLSLNDIRVADGSVLPVRVIVGHLETIFTYYQITHVVYTETDGSVTVSHGTATLNLSTLNGDIIPRFLGPAVMGTTEISILTPDGSVRLLDGVSGSFHA